MTSVCVSCPSSAPRRRATQRRAPVRRRRAPLRRRRTTIRRRRAPIRRKMKRGRGLTKFELAQVNPFDRKVDGVKIPDSNTQPSDTARSEDRVALTSLASGFAGVVAFNPTLANNSVTSTPVSATVWSWPAAYGGGVFSDQTVNYQSAYSSIRIVAHGLKLSCPAAPTSVTGFVHIACIPMSDYGSSTWSLPTTIGQLAQLPWYKRLTLAALTQRTFTVVNKFIDCTATRYFDPGSDLVGNSTDIAFQMGTSWGVIVVAVEGAPTTPTAVLSVENLVHYEGIPKFSSNQNSSPAANYDPQQLATTSRISANGGSGFFEGDERTALGAAYAAATSGMYQAGNEIVNDYVLPGLARAGYAATYATAGALAGRFGGGIQGVNTPRLFEG